MAGVFILVGLAAFSIILWVFLAIRSRRRTQRLDHDAAIAATLAAAGFHRTPLDDDDDPAENSSRSRYGSPDAFLRPRRSSSGLAMSSIPSAGRTSLALFHDDNDIRPSSDYIVPAGSRDGYISSPPFIYRTRSSNAMRQNFTGHTPQHSGGSHEPLLSSYNNHSPPQGPSDAPKALSDKPPQLEAIETPSVYTLESIADHRLDPKLRQRLQDDADSFRDLRDEEDYSRPVLGVCGHVASDSYSLISFLFRFEICLIFLQVRHLYDRTTIFLSATFTPSHCTWTYDNLPAFQPNTPKILSL